VLNACLNNSLVFVSCKKVVNLLLTLLGENVSFLLLWPPSVADADIIFCPVSSSFFRFYSSPNLSGCRLDVYHTLTHDVVLVRI